MGGALWWLSNLDSRVLMLSTSFLDAQRRQYANIERINILFIEKEKQEAEIKRLAGIQIHLLAAIKEINDGGSTALKRVQDESQRLATDFAGMNIRCNDVQGRVYEITRRLDLIEYKIGLGVRK